MKEKKENKQKMSYQPMYPSIGGLIKKMWRKKYNRILFVYKKGGNHFISKWLQLEDIIMSRIKETQKDKYCKFSLTCRS